MVRTLAILMLMTPAVGMAQEPIVPGQTLLGALGPGDRTQNGRAFDDYRYSAVPGAQARVVVRSRQLAADLNIYFYDDYFDMLPPGRCGLCPRGLPGVHGAGRRFAGSHRDTGLDSSR